MEVGVSAEGGDPPPPVVGRPNQHSEHSLLPLPELSNGNTNEGAERGKGGMGIGAGGNLLLDN